MPIILKGATSGQVTLDTPAIAGTNIITLPANTGTMQLLRLETAQNTTSGTSIDFLNIPSWAKKITVMFNEVSTNGTSAYLIQIGAGSIVTSGYVSTSNELNQSNATSGVSSTSGFALRSAVATVLASGSVSLMLVGSNIWIESHVFKTSTSNVSVGGGSLFLGSTLDRLRLTTANGTDTFDAGSVNILIEGN
jgi:hypothetical protein